MTFEEFQENVTKTFPKWQFQFEEKELTGTDKFSAYHSSEGIDFIIYFYLADNQYSIDFGYYNSKSQLLLDYEHEDLNKVKDALTSYLEREIKSLAKTFILLK